MGVGKTAGMEKAVCGAGNTAGTNSDWENNIARLEKIAITTRMRSVYNIGNIAEIGRDTLRDVKEHFEC